jgi:PelA/Pel-15E family pectate lyase
MQMRGYLVLSIVCWSLFPATLPADQQEPSPEQAAAALGRACSFFHEQVSCQGGYLWRYSADLTKREGEGRASETTVWVQPPGTPSVGQALLDVYEWTGDRRYLDLATAAGRCLVRGQLRSGGWDYRIEFAPEQRRRYAYRVDGGGSDARNVSTLDDNVTQAALSLLMRLDAVLDFQDAEIHEAAQFGLSALLAAQFPNGAWPQRFTGPPDADQFPVRQAGYPPSWPRTFPGVSYSGFYTFNDNAIADIIDVMFQAARTYDQPQYRQAAERAGNFILAAQMPEPQPGWAQQYNAEMQPAWARKFEPPSITGGEAAGIMRTLMRLYQETGDRRYLEPIPRALQYYSDSVLPDGKLARFYELQTNRPLFFTRDYELTYDDSDMPTHYAFKIGNWISSVRRDYERVAAGPVEARSEPESPRTPRMSQSLRRQANEIVGALDERGAWVEAGQLKYHGDDDPTRQVIDCRTFINNIRVLGSYLAAAGS